MGGRRYRGHGANTWVGGVQNAWNEVGRGEVQGSWCKDRNSNNKSDEYIYSHCTIML